jgi:hypothetical protein
MSEPGHRYLQKILATVEQLAPGQRLDTLVMSYATRARLAAVPGFDEAAYRHQIRMICDPFEDHPTYRVFPYADGIACQKWIELVFPKEAAVSRLTIGRGQQRHLRVVS